jgi:hypothetical protein
VIDQRISDDLAIVARTSRARPTSLDTTLAAVATQDAPRGFGVAAGYVHAMRVARASAGIVALATVGVLLLYLRFWHDDELGYLDRMIHMPILGLALCVIGAVSTTHVIAARFAMSAKAPDPARLAKVSIAASIGGATAFCVFFGMASVLGGSDAVILVMVPGGEWHTAAAVATIVIAKAGIRSRRWMLPVGLVLLVGTIAVGFVIGLRGGETPAPESVAVRTALTATGTIALFLVITTIVLRLHEHDDQYAS